MKACTKCGETKPPDQFCRDRRMKDGLHSYCRSCMRAYASAWKKANPARERRSPQVRAKWAEIARQNAAEAGQ